MSKAIAVSILTVMFTGLMAWAGGEIKNAVSLSRNNASRVNTIEKSQDKMESKLDDLHWYLIRRTKVEIPKGDK